MVQGNGKCPLCQGQVVVSASSAPGRPLLRCSRCALVYNDCGLQPPGAVTGEADHGGRRGNPWLIADYRLLTRRSGVPRRVLDVGCGDGSLLAFLQSRGIQGAGVEASEQARRRCGEHFHGPLFENLQAAVAHGQRYDRMVLLFSLEHMLSPVQVLSTLCPLLVDGGELVIRVPNIDSLESRILGRRWFQANIPGHLYHFNRRSLGHLLEQAGFEVLEINTMITPQGAISMPCSLFPQLGSALDPDPGWGRPEQFIMRGALAGLTLACLPLVLAECALGRGPILTVVACKTSGAGDNGELGGQATSLRSPRRTGARARSQKSPKGDSSAL